ncbi:MAG: hypothetical protein DRH56_00570 [Deltaproteobacteria bacterium]|nr:MAG: hypothetical protein DRH56_00570 [Deltaproteobacteria bacterium]
MTVTRKKKGRSGKRRSVLKKQSVRRKRRRDWTAFLRVFPRIGSGLVKAVFAVLVVIGISLCFVSLYHYLLASPCMKLRQVDVEGVGREIREELIHACGLNSDLSLLELNLDRLKETMERHPWVRSVRLIRRFPHTLVVQVEKQVPAAVVVMDRLYYMNRQGEIFKEVAREDETDFPVVTGIARDRPESGAELRRAARILRTIATERGVWSVGGLSEIHAGPDGGISLYFEGIPARIAFRVCDLASKMEGLKKVVEHLRRTGRIRRVTRIDLDQVDGALVAFRQG